MGSCSLVRSSAWFRTRRTVDLNPLLGRNWISLRSSSSSSKLWRICSSSTMWRRGWIVRSRWSVWNLQVHILNTSYSSSQSPSLLMLSTLAIWSLTAGWCMLIFWCDTASSPQRMNHSSWRSVLDWGGGLVWHCQVLEKASPFRE